MIKQVKYTNFCQHTDYVLNLQKGLNIILGKNTFGKTNLLEGISYGIYGKTNHSTINKIINYHSKSAQIECEHTEFKPKRTRNETTSKLENITQNELNNLLNFSYEEYLRLFYISRQEATKLFEPSYFKSFLISLFNLEKYSKVYERLRIEKQTLEQIQEPKKINKELYAKRINKLTKILQGIKEQYLELGGKRKKILDYKSKLNVANGKVLAAQDDYNKKSRRLSWDKCFTCGKLITKEDKDKLMDELDQLKIKILKIKKILDIQFNKVNIVYNNLDAKIGILENKSRQASILIATINERLREQIQPNKDRIKEINILLPIFSNNGFPAYLLQTYTPIIQETANNLLNFVFNDLSINIRTHRPNSNIPDLKIMVLRNGKEAGTLDDVSGAESFLINLCLRLGIIVIFKQLHNTIIDWLICDEYLDKLDTTNIYRALNLLKNFLKLGYLSQIILVSHREDLQNLDNINYIKLGDSNGSQN